MCRFDYWSIWLLLYTILYLKLQMTDMNVKITELFQRHKQNSPELVQQLLMLLLGNGDAASTNCIQTAVLFSMQGMHEWANVLNFSQKWKAEDYRKEFLVRMKKRVNQSPEIKENDDINAQLTRVVQKYWRTRSPKKSENIYHQPIQLNKLLKSRESFIEPLNSKKTQSDQQLDVNSKGSEALGTQNEHENENSKNSRGNPSTITGRPPILKKTSNYIDSLKNKNENKNDNQSKGRQLKPQSKNTLSKLLKQNNSRGNLAQKEVISEQDQFVNRRQTINIQKNQDTDPIQQVILQNVNKAPTVQSENSTVHVNEIDNAKNNNDLFNQSEFLKKKNISPIKRLIPQKRFIKISKKQASPTQKQDHAFDQAQHDFSFMHQSPRFFEKKTSPARPGVDNQASPNTFEEFTNKRISVFKQNSNQINRKSHFQNFPSNQDSVTPMFGVKQQEYEFLSPDQLSMVDKIQPWNVHKEYERKWGLDAISIFLKTYKQVRG